ncbi:MAG: glycosyltransferase family 2 protein [Planctomycetes bacterium]|nr:glycosyltransferase family 2 protein [Planctomycetota bacterium]
MATVSVVIPTYNRVGRVQNAVESVLAQTYSVAEIIVVDDGSSDQTMAALEKYQGLTLLQQVNSGPSAARNLGARHAKGEWLAFLDSDDLWQKDKLAKQVAFSEAHPDIKWLYTNEIWIRDGVRVNQCHHHAKLSGWIYPECLKLCLVSPSSIMLKRDLFWAKGGFDEALWAAEDYDLWLRIACDHPVGYLEEALIVKYGGHEDQLSRQWGIDRFRVMALEKMLYIKELKAKPDWWELTRKNIVRRLGILAKGYKKHGKVEEAEAFLRQREVWQDTKNIEP